MEYEDVIGAVVTLGLSVLIAYAVDRFLLAGAVRAAARLGEVSATRAARTRVGVVRRLIFTVIVVTGVFLALGQFTALDSLATGLLASTAVIGVVLGFAAQKVLANPLAGILLAITQPIRIGDKITIDDETGRVDDVSLSYTYVNLGDGRLMVVPNEKVVTSVVFNRSTGDRNAPASVSVWLPPAADIQAARDGLAPLEASRIEVAEVSPDGVRLTIDGPRGPDRTAVAGEEAALRERAHRALREAGIIGDSENQD